MHFLAREDPAEKKKKRQRAKDALTKHGNLQNRTWRIAVHSPGEETEEDIVGPRVRNVQSEKGALQVVERGERGRR
jgi:hypothetical protein